MIVLDLLVVNASNEVDLLQQRLHLVLVVDAVERLLVEVLQRFYFLEKVRV